MRRAAPVRIMAAPMDTSTTDIGSIICTQPPFQNVPIDPWYDIAVAPKGINYIRSVDRIHPRSVGTGERSLLYIKALIEEEPNNLDQHALAALWGAPKGIAGIVVPRALYLGRADEAVKFDGEGFKALWQVLPFPGSSVNGFLVASF